MVALPVPGIVCGVDHEIGRVDVVSLQGCLEKLRVDDILRVQELKCLARLVEVFEGLELGEHCPTILVVEEVAPLGVLHHHVEQLVFREGVPKFNDMGVVDLGVDFNFPLDELELGL